MLSHPEFSGAEETRRLVLSKEQTPHRVTGGHSKPFPEEGNAALPAWRQCPREPPASGLPEGKPPGELPRLRTATPPVPRYSTWRREAPKCREPRCNQSRSSEAAALPLPAA